MVKMVRRAHTVFIYLQDEPFFNDFKKVLEHFLKSNFVTRNEINFFNSNIFLSYCMH